MSDTSITVGTKVLCDGIEWKFKGEVTQTSPNVVIVVTELLTGHYGGEPHDDDYVELGTVMEFTTPSFEHCLKGRAWSIVSTGQVIEDPTMGLLLRRIR